MIIDTINPAMADWDRQLASEHERLNFPDLHFQFLMKIADRLLERERIEHPEWLDLYDIALGARGDAFERLANYPCALQPDRKQLLLDAETGWAVGSTQHKLFEGVGLDGCFSRVPSGRMVAWDRKGYQQIGQFEDYAEVLINGRLYRLRSSDDS